MKSWAGGHESVCSSIGTRVGNNGNILFSHVCFTGGLNAEPQFL